MGTVRRPASWFVVLGQVGVGAKVSRASTNDAKSKTLSSMAMSSVSTDAMRSTLASMRSARLRKYFPRSWTPSAAQAGKASSAAPRARSASCVVPRDTSANLRDQSSGERSSNVVGEETRWLLMKWPVATCTRRRGVALRS